MNMPLLFEVGEMIERSQQSGVWVDSDEAKLEIGNFVRDIAQGRSGKDLTWEQNAAWGEMGRRLHGADRLPRELADAVGLNPESTYADLYIKARFWTRMRKDGALTGSAQENAFLAAES
jgi:hypothetical protein